MQQRIRQIRMSQYVIGQGTRAIMPQLFIPAYRPFRRSAAAYPHIGQANTRILLCPTDSSQNTISLRIGIKRVFINFIDDRNQIRTGIGPYRIHPVSRKESYITRPPTFLGKVGCMYTRRLRRKAPDSHHQEEYPNTCPHGQGSPYQCARIPLRTGLCEVIYYIYKEKARESVPVTRPAIQGLRIAHRNRTSNAEAHADMRNDTVYPYERVH